MPESMSTLNRQNNTNDLHQMLRKYGNTVPELFDGHQKEEQDLNTVRPCAQHRQYVAEMEYPWDRSGLPAHNVSSSDK